MAKQARTYRSLMLQKVQRIANSRGGLANIPREMQEKLGFDLIAKRGGAYSVSIRIPKGELRERISELRVEARPFPSSPKKPEPEGIFRGYTPVPSQANPTMDDFWIMQGWYKDDRRGIRLTRARWREGESVQKKAVRFMLDEVLRKDPAQMRTRDFNSNRLSGLFSEYFDSSPYLALVEAGYAYSIEESLEHAKAGNFQSEKIYPWEMVETPNIFDYGVKENRVAAVKWLVWKLGKDPREIEWDDFNSNGLAGLISSEHYKNSPYKALVEAGYAYSTGESLRHARAGAFRDGKIYPWEMGVTPYAFSYEVAENRIAAVKWLVWKLGKDPRRLEWADFNSNGLSGLISEYYGNSPYKALLEAGYAYSLGESLEHAKTGNFREGKLYPWEMQRTPSEFDYGMRENRVAAIMWFPWKLSKEPRDVLWEDFSLGCLSGLLRHYYESSPYNALQDAGLVTPEDEAYMRKRTGFSKTE
jgi:hypothetical protein